MYERNKKSKSFPVKFQRDAFLYLEPKIQDDHDFAQCIGCRVFVPKDSLQDKSADRCVFHGSTVKVDEQMSCGLYCPWPDKPEPKVIANHASELDSGLKAAVTPKESGLVDREVRCENCYYFKADTSECELFYSLGLNSKVRPTGCCNANSPK